MKIGYKIGVIILAVFAVVIGIGITAQKCIVAPGFEEIEKWFIRNEIGWINDLITRESNRIGGLCRDWARWDDTYDYVLMGDEEYLLANFSAETLTNNSLNFAAIVDLEGNIVAARSCDIENEQIVDAIFEDFKAAKLPVDSPLLMMNDQDRLIGIGVSLNGPAFITAHPILRTDGSGPFVGTLIMAHVLDEHFLGDIFSVAGHVVRITEANLADCGTDDYDDTYITNYPGGAYSVCKEIRTVYGDIDYVLQLITPDFVGRHNKKYDTIIVSLILAVSAFGFVLMLFMIMKIVVTPIRSLEQHIRRISSSKSLELVPVGKSKDEIAILAAEFNNMVMQLKKDHQLREQMNLKLQESNSNLRQFAHSVSHDLKEPLRTITSYLQLIELTTKPDGEIAEYMGYVMSASKRMYEMINDLLEYSKSSSMDYPLKQCDVEGVVKNILAELDLIMQESRAVVDLKPLPEVLGYEPLLNQIFRNLITNAVKYRRPGVAPQIEIGCNIVEGVKTFYIKDNGKGIDSHYYKKIFEMFERLEHDSKSGTGLGLAICKKVAERHNGEIWVESKEGEGSTFFFTIKTE